MTGKHKNKMEASLIIQFFEFLLFFFFFSFFTRRESEDIF